jgi:hypothetical protein
LDGTILVNEDGAESVVNSVQDPIVRNLMLAAWGVARLRIARSGELITEPEEELPQGPFDMRFFALVMRDLFLQKDAIIGMLRGESPAQASGWDVADQTTR